MGAIISEINWKKVQCNYDHLQKYNSFDWDVSTLHKLRRGLIMNTNAEETATRLALEICHHLVMN